MAFAAGLAAIGGALTARHAGGSIVIGGIDLLSSLQSQAIMGYTYTDNTNDKADDLSVEIADPARTWMKTFLPQKGVECTAQITVHNWNLPGDVRTLDCGTFMLDQVDFSGPPNVVAIRATSILGVKFKSEKHFKSWENVTLSSIVSEIATENGYSLVWEAKDDPTLERVDQIETPDCEFVRDLAKENSLSLKIFNKQLILYSEEDYDSRPPAYALMYGASRILSYSFSSKLNDTYKSATNTYVDPRTGELIETKVDATEPPESDAELKGNEQVQGEEESESPYGPEGREEDSGDIHFNNESAAANAASERKTKSKLREKNKREYDCQMSVFGSPDYLSGLNAELIGWGIFDGKWFISSTIHSITSSGYVTQLSMRKALQGY